jgi:hypothetical protein
MVTISPATTGGTYVTVKDRLVVSPLVAPSP